MYTNDTDYATDDPFRHNNFIYKKVGNYRYTATDGNLKAAVAVKATKHKTSEINPQTYLKNKNLSCCQCQGDIQHLGITKNDEKDWCTTNTSPEGCVAYDYSYDDNVSSVPSGSGIPLLGLGFFFF